MNLCLDAVLDDEALRAVRAWLADASFSSGKTTAGWHAQGLKHNLQTVHEQAGQRVLQALHGHPLFQAAALPSRIRTPLFSRYQPGMGYGTHVDDALMGTNAPIRSDLAVTLFLTAPADYYGGELVLDTHSGVQDYKLAAGQTL
ncbi:MAG: Fe2+-dependent dioxygenase, partial [Panacagrimonas sp.]